MSSRGGRPPFAPTDEQRKNVEIMVGLGIRQDSICALVRDKKDRPISEATLRKHFRKEIDQGQAKLIAMVGSFMIQTILGRAPPPGITPITDPKIRGSFAELFARTRMGWRETIRSDVGNADGKPFILNVCDTDSRL
jgi:uracil-DNA glycosylase